MQQEKEKRVTLRQQWQHDQKESENQRHHQMEIEKIKADMAIKKVEIEHRNKLELQKEKQRHDTVMQDKRNEDKRLQLKIKEQLIIEKRLELQMQDKRNEEKSLELQCLKTKLKLKEESGKFNSSFKLVILCLHSYACYVLLILKCMLPSFTKQWPI